MWQKGPCRQAKLRTLRREGYCGWSGWAQCNSEDLYKRDARGSKAEKGDVRTEAKAGVMCFEDGSQEMWAVSRSWKRHRIGFSPRTFRSKAALPTHFGLLSSRTQDNKLVLSSASRLVVTCSVSLRKLTQSSKGEVLLHPKCETWERKGKS